METKTFAIIPAHNEEKHIDKIVRKTRKYVDKVMLLMTAVRTTQERWQKEVMPLY